MHLECAHTPREWLSGERVLTRDRVLQMAHAAPPFIPCSLTRTNTLVLSYAHAHMRQGVPTKAT